MRDLDAKAMLDLAARAAFRGTGHVEPNPLVGCVIVRPGSELAADRIIGIGHHRRFGGPHAEVEALNRCRELGNDPAGATVYVTLEPCNAQGRNPPCVQALIHAKVGRVICAARDESAGKRGGAETLRAAGIPCDFTSVSQRAIDLSEPWRHRQTTPLPWVIAKWAQTIDGKLATFTGDSKWISSERSRVRVHRIRSAVDAVMVGANTVETDNPRLDVRGVPLRRGRQPLRVVVAPDWNLVLDRTLVLTAHTQPTLIACEEAGDPQTANLLMEAGVRFLTEPNPTTGWLARQLARLRAEHGVQTLLVEGGPRLLGSMLAEKLVQEIHVHTGSRLMGDGLMSQSIGGFANERSHGTIDQAQAWRLLSVRRVGDDVHSVYRPLHQPLDQNASDG